MSNEVNIQLDPATEAGLTLIAKVYSLAGVQQGADISMTEPVAGWYTGNVDLSTLADGTYNVRFATATTFYGSGPLRIVDGAEVTLTAGETNVITTVKKVLTNKRVTNPSTGQQIIYDDDNTTTLLSGAIYEDVAGTQTYRGQGVERADRLT